MATFSKDEKQALLNDVREIREQVTRLRITVFAISSGISIFVAVGVNIVPKLL